MSNSADIPPSRWGRCKPLVYALVSVLLWTTQGMGLNLISANTVQLQGALGATLTETNWLIAAYMAPNVSLTILLTKIRTQIGLRRFAEVAIAIFAATSLLHLFVFDLNSGVAVRFVAGAAASPISTLGFLYMLEAFPPAKKLSWGLSLALMLSSAMPALARLISPFLLDLGQWQELYTFELGLALLSLAAVWRLPLTPIPRAQVMHPLDFVSYPLVALGFGLIAVVLAVGRYYWWLEADWIGWCLAAALVAIGLAAAIEATRETPLMDFRWLFGREMLQFTLVLLLFRLALAEQSSGALGLFNALGLLNEQSRLLNIVILLGTLAGGLVCGLLLRPAQVPLLYGIALACIATGAFMDSQATNLTRPDEMLLSQGLIAFGGAIFLPPALLVGFTRALARGPTYITSFIVVFLFTQSIGGLMGSALFGSLVIIREKFHSSQIVENLVLSDPLVAARIRQLGAAYGRVLLDPQLLNAEGAALLGQQATREATILAYNDAFLLIAMAAAAGLALLLSRALWSGLRARLSPPAAPAASAPGS
jgi:MFS family permease